MTERHKTPLRKDTLYPCRDDDTRLNHMV